MIAPPASTTADSTLVVDETESGCRVDAFLVRRQIVPSSSAARRAVAAGVVRVNGRTAKKGAHLAPGDVVDLDGGHGSDTPLVPAPQIELTVLYQDDVMVAVDKPAGMHAHPLHAGDAPTVASALVARFPECASASLDPREGGLGHRLDHGTSGVLLAARSREAWHRLREALAAPSCVKVYLAEVRGNLPATDAALGEYVLPGPRRDSFVVTAPIGRHGRHGGKVVLGAGRQPLPARTEVSLLDHQPPWALVEARLARGRAHQVRAHLSQLGAPVRGDAVYGEAEDGVELRLHAFTVSLPHPVTGQVLRIEAPAPAWVRAYSNWAMLVSTSR
jgi:23S rRNA pseudouridine1911/1915/1917 synthase